MLLKKLKQATLAICLSLLISSCEHMKGLTVCISKPSDGGFYCSKDGNDKTFLPFKDSTDYVAMPIADAQRYYNQCYDPRLEKVQ